MTTRKTLIGASVLLLVLSAVFGILNTNKSRGLRTQAAQSEAARIDAQRQRDSREAEIKKREAPMAAKSGDTQAKAVDAEAAKLRTEKEELQAKLKANETEIAELRKRVEEGGATPAIVGNPSAASPAELQTQLEDAKKQLDAAEKEKVFLSEKMRTVQERPTQAEPERKRRPAAGGNPGVRGTVLAVNQVYNFVVLNLGGRQGVEVNTEMLVLRGGALIGKIRVSSVEPATAIGDIIPSSLARGVQVQPGDTVIYAGTNS